MVIGVVIKVIEPTGATVVELPVGETSDLPVTDVEGGSLDVIEEVSDTLELPVVALEVPGALCEILVEFCEVLVELCEILVEFCEVDEFIWVDEDFSDIDPEVWDGSVFDWTPIELATELWLFTEVEDCDWDDETCPSEAVVSFTLLVVEADEVFGIDVVELRPLVVVLLIWVVPPSLLVDCVDEEFKEEAGEESCEAVTSVVWAVDDFWEFEVVEFLDVTWLEDEIEEISKALGEGGEFTVVVSPVWLVDDKIWLSEAVEFLDRRDVELCLCVEVEFNPMRRELLGASVTEGSTETEFTPTERYKSNSKHSGDFIIIIDSESMNKMKNFKLWEDQKKNQDTS
jgi:hypothetical protein